MHVCVCGFVGGGRTDRVCSFIPLRLELQAKADLVAASVDVLAVEESRQCQLDSCRNTHTSGSGQLSHLHHGSLLIQAL